MAQYRSVIKRVLSTTSSTQVTWPYIGPTMAICGVLLWGSAMVYASFYARLPLPNTSVEHSVVALGAIAGLFVAIGAFGSATRHVLLWPIIFVGGLLAGGFCVSHFGVDGVVRLGDDARQAFVDERREFATSPTGFPFFARNAMSAWGVDLELNDSDQAGVRAADNESDGSPASVEVHRGYCVVNLTPRIAARFLGAAEPPDYRQDVLWVSVAHEVGRCVDVSRDENASRSFGAPFSSLAPVDGVGVATTHDYFLAASRPSTRQWRESFADAFTVGWLRLAKPQYAQQLADTLRHDLEARSSDDAPSQTSCAIAAAMRAAPPASLEDLPAWADRLRSTSCAR